MFLRCFLRVRIKVMSQFLAYTSGCLGLGDLVESKKPIQREFGWRRFWMEPGMMGAKESAQNHLERFNGNPVIGCFEIRFTGFYFAKFTVWSESVGVKVPFAVGIALKNGSATCWSFHNLKAIREF